MEYLEKYGKYITPLSMLLGVTLMLIYHNRWFLLIGFIIPLLISILIYVFFSLPFKWTKKITYKYCYLPQLSDIANKNLNPIISFPMTIWLAFEGEDIFLTKGDKALKEAFMKRIDGIVEGLSKPNIRHSLAELPDGYDEADLSSDELKEMEKIMKEGGLS